MEAKMEDRNDRISLNIKEIRKEKGLTQEQLAKKVGVTKACMCRWENWNINMPTPTLRTLERIAQALNVPIKNLFNEQNETNNLHK